jgi:hypothetical protein
MSLFLLFETKIHFAQFWDFGFETDLILGSSQTKIAISYYRKAKFGMYRVFCEMQFWLLKMHMKNHKSVILG